MRTTEELVPTIMLKYDLSLYLLKRACEVRLCCLKKIFIKNFAALSFAAVYLQPCSHL